MPTEPAEAHTALQVLLALKALIDRENNEQGEPGSGAAGGFKLGDYSLSLENPDPGPFDHAVAAWACAGCPLPEHSPVLTMAGALSWQSVVAVEAVEVDWGKARPVLRLHDLPAPGRLWSGTIVPDIELRGRRLEWQSPETPALWSEVRGSAPVIVTNGTSGVVMDVADELPAGFGRVTAWCWLPKADARRSGSTPDASGGR